MARLHTSFDLGYHGCARRVGETVLAGGESLIRSERDYDWLGPGTYFWEADAVRAWEWADAKVARGEVEEAFVLGAAIDFGNCLDLMARDSLELLRSAYASYAVAANSTVDGPPLLTNRGRDGDKLLRFLDCAVIRRLRQSLDESDLPPFDSVRGLFTEGG